MFNDQPAGDLQLTSHHPMVVNRISTVMLMLIMIFMVKIPCYQHGTVDDGGWFQRSKKPFTIKHGRASVGSLLYVLLQAAMLAMVDASD